MFSGCGAEVVVEDAIASDKQLAGALRMKPHAGL